MKKIFKRLFVLLTLVVVFGLVAAVSAEPVALAIRNDTGNDIVVVLTDKQGNNMYWERHNCIKNGEVGMIVLDSEQHINVGFNFDVETSSIKGGIWRNLEKAWNSGLTDSYLTISYTENGPVLCGNLISKFN